MKKLYLDVNIILDFLLQRHPFYVDAGHLLSLAYEGKIAVYTPPNSFIFAFYQMHYAGTTPEDARHKLAILRKSVNCVTVTDDIIDASIRRLQPDDLEDAYQIEVAASIGADYLITRDRSGFRKCPIPVSTAKGFVDSYYADL